MNILKKLLKLIVILIITVATAEILLITYSYLRFDTDMVYLPNIRMGRNPNPKYLNGISGPSYFTTNSLGLRGPEPQKDALFGVAIGSSTTQNVWLDDSETWPHLLMNEINSKSDAKVIINSAAHGGLVAKHSTLMLRSLIKQDRKPDFVIWMPGATDKGMLQRQAPNYVGLAKDEEKAAFATAINRWTTFPISFKETLIHQYFEQVEKRTSKGIKRVFGKEVSTKRDGHKHYQSALSLKQRKLEVWESIPKNIELNFDMAIADFEAQTMEMIRLCNENDIKLCIITQPMNYRPTMAKTELDDLHVELYDGKKLAPKVMSQMLNRFNSHSLQISRENGVTCIDLFKVYSNKKNCFYDSIHFNEKGSVIAAKNIFSELAGWFKK